MLAEPSAGPGRLAVARALAPDQLPWTFTVAQALKLPVFHEAKAELVAGADHLNNVIKWVHSGEIVDIARFLSGGEFLLTAGSGIGHTEAQQRAYLRGLSDAGAAGIGVELGGRVFSRTPPAVLDEANRLGFPVIAFGREIAFVKVATQVHECLADLRVQQLLEGEVANAAFTELLLNGEDSVAMVAELAHRISCPSVLEDGAHQMRAYYGRTPRADVTIAHWDKHSRLTHEQHSGDLGCAREPIAVKGDVWGWLHVLYGDIALSSSDHYTIGRASAAIAIALLSEEAHGARRSQRAGALINRLMLGDISGDRFVERAIALGRDFRGRSFMVVVAGGADREAPYGEPELSRLLATVPASAVVTDTGEELIAIVALPPRRGEQVIVDALARAPARIGISRVTNGRQLRLAIQQASNAYAATGTAPDIPRLVRFDDLGVSRLLLALAQGPELASYVEDELGKLMEHDAGSANPLLPTLRAYLACDGRKSQAAKQLFVQRRTLYYRLDRISALLQMSLDDPPVRQRLQLAVHGLDLLNQRSAVHRLPTQS